MADAPPRWPDRPAALAVTFAWGPAIDLLLEVFWTARGSTHAESRIGWALGAVVARYAIARAAFRSSTAFDCSIRLALPTLLLGGALRLVSLWPVVGESGDAVLENLVFPPFVVAFYASSLPPFLRRVEGTARDPAQSLAGAAVWVALGQSLRSFFGFWDPANFHRASLGLDWATRFALGVFLPIVVAATGGLLATRRANGLGPLASTARATLCIPAVLLCLWFVSAVFSGDRLLIALARTPDGTEILVSERSNDPNDVLLAIRRPGAPWRELPFVRAEPLWAGRIDVASRGTTATISAYDVVVATVDWQSGSVTEIAPMTFFRKATWR